jgi:hypothetical protein
MHSFEPQKADAIRMVNDVGREAGEQSHVSAFARAAFLRQALLPLRRNRRQSETARALGVRSTANERERFELENGREVIEQRAPMQCLSLSKRSFIVTGLQKGLVETLATQLKQRCGYLIRRARGDR